MSSTASNPVGDAVFVFALPPDLQTCLTTTIDLYSEFLQTEKLSKYRESFLRVVASPNPQTATSVVGQHGTRLPTDEDILREILPKCIPKPPTIDISEWTLGRVNTILDRLQWQLKDVKGRALVQTLVFDVSLLVRYWKAGKEYGKLLEQFWESFEKFREWEKQKMAEKKMAEKGEDGGDEPLDKPSV